MNLSLNMTLELNVLCRPPNEEYENEDDTGELKKLHESCIEENI